MRSSARLTARTSGRQACSCPVRSALDPVAAGRQAARSGRAGTLVHRRGLQPSRSRYHMRDYALRSLSAFYTDDMAVLSPARLPRRLFPAVHLATSGAEARERIGPADREASSSCTSSPRRGGSRPPLDPPSTAAHAPTDRGHYVPVDFDPARYRVLFTRVRSHRS